jgi:hypothetical protein
MNPGMGSPQLDETIGGAVFAPLIVYTLPLNIFASHAPVQALKLSIRWKLI